jgi:N-acylneuraminate cytidylyltransferase
VAYHDAGQWYWLRRSSFLTQEKVFMKNCVPVILPETEVQDIDNEEDWLLAEAKYALRQREKL